MVSFVFVSVALGFLICAIPTYLKGNESGNGEWFLLLCAVNNGIASAFNLQDQKQK